MLYIRCYEALYGTYVQFGPFTKIEPGWPDGGGALTAYQGDDMLFFDWSYSGETFMSPVKGDIDMALSSVEIGDDSE